MFLPCPSRLLPVEYISFDSQKYWTDYRWNSPEVIVTTNIQGEIRTGTMEQDTTKYSNRRQSVLLRCQTGADAQRINSQIRFHLQFAFFHSQDYYTISFNSLNLQSSVRSLRLFAFHGNAGTENIYNGCRTNIYIFIHHNMIESTEQKEQQKPTQKRKRKK